MSLISLLGGFALEVFQFSLAFLLYIFPPHKFKIFLSNYQTYSSLCRNVKYLTIGF